MVSDTQAKKNGVEIRWKEKAKTSEQTLRLSWDKSVFLFHVMKEQWNPDWYG